MRSLPSLKALSAFEAVSRLGSVNAAADELHVSQSAVSHQIANLEDMIGVSLFKRDGRGLVLSETGRDYSQKISVLLEGIVLATEDASRYETRPQLTVSSPPTFLHYWLLPNLKNFLQSEPKLDLRLIERVSVDGSEGHIDLAVEYRLQKSTSGESLFLLNDDLVPLASPEYVSDHSIRSLPCLARATLIETERRLSSWKTVLPEWPGFDKVKFLAVSYSFQAFEAARLGYGVALGNKINAAPLLESKQLIIPFDLKMEGAALRAKYFLTKPSSDTTNPYAEKFSDWLISGISNSKHARNSRNSNCRR